MKVNRHKGLYGYYFIILWIIQTLFDQIGMLFPLATIALLYSD